MKRMLFLSAFLLLTPPTFAAEGEPAAQPVENEKDEKRTQTEDTEPKTADSKSKNKSKDKEIFIPSEEISEDFAVSFPVDI